MLQPNDADPEPGIVRSSESEFTKAGAREQDAYLFARVFTVFGRPLVQMTNPSGFSSLGRKRIVVWASATLMFPNTPQASTTSARESPA